MLNETQIAIRDVVRAFAQDQIRPNAFAYEAAGAYPPGLFEEIAALGLMGMTAAAEHGGAEADYVSYALALIKLAAGDGALSTIVSIQNSLIVSALVRLGTPSQQARFLPDLVAGKMTGAFALTETDAGSDASAIRTRATRCEHGWTLDGAKQFITSGKMRLHGAGGARHRGRLWALLHKWSLWDSRGESVLLAGVDEQTDTRALQDDELAGV